LRGWLKFALSFAGLVGVCVSPGCAVDDVGVEPGYRWELPVGYPAPVVPEINPMSDEKVELGRYLFYDERLSGNGTQACASCHEQEHAFAGGVALSEGSTGELMPRHSQALVGAAYSYPLTWASVVLVRLEEQILVPMFARDPVELGITGNEEKVLDRLRDDAHYPHRFAAAFPDDDEPITFSNVAKALAAFVRSIVPSGQAPYHRYAYGGEEGALTEAQTRGLELFDELGCRACHDGFHLTRAVHYEGSGEPARDDAFHNMGLYNLDDEGRYPFPNTGLHEATRRPEDMGKFRVPTLHNVAVTGPYMHDGSVATLEEVIQIYERGGRLLEDGPLAGDGAQNPHKSPLITGFSLSPDERGDLLSFLESLTDHELLRDPRYADPAVAL
jgi:cytochrome c peroxidase